ncbi:uncharacterized protein LOC115628564 [Scaptodrosophila lebanonensis]|uniref:Uncharacterized protein LOC115628564 n=1 Tax=Drosophila lebanonensis TaxID=7225 RepID=A0A6J2TZG6_DROLE|nr:uncharacterized protein LOC115628564 [Scaptodrosophila lebanonensis]
MFRNLCIVRKRLLPTILYPRYNACKKVSTNAVKLSLTFKSNMPLLASLPLISGGHRGIKVQDIDIRDLARNDIEFARDFTSSLSSLSMPSTPESSQTSDGEASEPTTGAPESGSLDGVVTGGGCDSATSILDKDGNPIVPVDIDGWADYNEDDEGGPTVQNTTENHVEIGNDEEYKALQALMVPDEREAHFEYKGIKVQLPKTVHKDKGTYRFRRDPEDFEAVGDDMRLCRFDKK